MVSVIIPIYQVERYIARCARSLMEQTLKDVEYIFVDDCSPDGSIGILEQVVAEYPWCKNRIKIIRHEQNKGLPAARNAGLKAASGEYIFHCDSDDWVEKGMLEELCGAAKARDADIVWCNWYLSFDKRERYMWQPGYRSSDEALEGILSGKMKYNVWNKLIRKSLYTDNKISFPEGHGMAEDMTMIRLFACARRVAYVPKAFYHYVRTNEYAFTSTVSQRHIDDILYNTTETIAFVKERKGDKLGKEIEWFKLAVKFPLLISDNDSMYKIWKIWFPESNSFIFSNKNISLRSRLLQYAAWKGHYWVIWLYYKFVYRLVYGIIYR